MTESIFWISASFIIYTYAGYPLLIWLLAKTKKEQQPNINNLTEWPEVTIVIPVYNERKNVEKKIKNIISLDYPKDKLSMIFVSDGSTDDTNEFLEKIPQVKIIAYPERKGKPTALNTAVEHVNSEVIVFTDVRQELDSLAIKYLVARLMQPGIGAVSGELCHKISDTGVGKNVGLYWRYEKWIRKSESKVYATSGVTGALYAIHKNDYIPLRKDTLLDDFEVPMKILATGKRVVLETNAKLYDVSQEDIAGEKIRKIRTLTGNYQSFAWNPWLFMPWKNPIFFQFISHKVFRLIVPYTMVTAFYGSLMSSGSFYVWLALLQSIFYLLGLAGMYSTTIRNNKLVGFIVVFIQLNSSAVIALKQYLFNKVQVKWEKA